jgi:two-component system LytT family response regulator
MSKLWNSLIIDDEKLARERLKRLLSDYPQHFNIVGEAVSGDDAQLQIESLKPDLVFLDIEMPGKGIFDVLKDVTHKPFVVFCTAYDNYALQAFQVFSVDYLVKPVDNIKIESTIQKLSKISAGVELVNYSQLENLIDKIKKENSPQSIPYKIGDKTILIKLTKIVYFETNDKYVDFYDNMGNAYLTDLSLKYLEQKLSDNFLRISKSIIINRDYVKEIHKYFRGKVIFMMDDLKKTKLTSGSFYGEQIKKIFEL